MSVESSKLDRRSTRLSISIPITISGIDANGRGYTEHVRTLVVNNHGGKISTVRPLTMGAEVLIENRANRLIAKASVVWMGEEVQEGQPRQIALQLTEAQNIWGIAFPPDDWSGNEG